MSISFKETEQLEQGNAQTVATFTGTLLKRSRLADSKLVQLVFREGGENWLCVSSNPVDATWPVGEQYRIEGFFRQLGSKQYIHEPRIAKLKKHRKLTFAKVLIIAVILALLGSAYGAYTMLRPSHSGQSLGASTHVSQPAQATTASSPVTPANQATATQTTTPTAAAPATTKSTTTTTKKSTTTSKTTTSAKTSTPSTQSQSTPTTPATQTSTPTDNSQANTPPADSPATPTDTGTQPSTGTIDPDAASTTNP